MIIISSVHVASGDPTDLTYMVDKVGGKLDANDVPKLRGLLKKLSQAFNTKQCEQKMNSTPEWKNDEMPYKAKKAKRLGYAPTDASLPSP